MSRTESYSSLATLAACAQRYDFTYNEGLEPLGIDLPSHLGSALHAAFKVLYRGGWGGIARLPEAKAALTTAWGDVKPPLVSKKPWITLGYALARLDTYVADRDKSKTTLELAEVVAEFSEEMHAFDWVDAAGRLVHIRGVPDFVVRHEGKTYVVDHKTTTSGKYGISDFYPDTSKVMADVVSERAEQQKALEYTLGHQLRVYAAMYEALTGERVDGGLINAVWCGELAIGDWLDSKKQPRKGAKDLIRIVSFGREQIEMAHEWVRGNLVVRDACAAANVWPKNEHACDSFGGCSFIDLCLAPSAAARRARMSNFKRSPKDAK